MQKEIRTASIWMQDTAGATAIEYGLIMSGIAIALTVIIFTIGQDVQNVFQSISTWLQSVLPAG